MPRSRIKAKTRHSFAIQVESVELRDGSWQAVSEGDGATCVAYGVSRVDSLSKLYTSLATQLVATERAGR